MRVRSKPPLNRQYFHTNPSIDRRDIALLKRKIELMNVKKKKRELDQSSK